MYYQLMFSNDLSSRVTTFEELLCHVWTIISMTFLLTDFEALSFDLQRCRSKNLINHRQITQELDFMYQVI